MGHVSNFTPDSSDTVHCSSFGCSTIPPGPSSVAVVWLVYFYCPAFSKLSFQFQYVLPYVRIFSNGYCVCCVCVCVVCVCVLCVCVYMCHQTPPGGAGFTHHTLTHRADLSGPCQHLSPPASSWLLSTERYTHTWPG